MGAVEWCLMIMSLLGGIYYYLISNYDYWKNRGVNGPKPGLLFGTLKDVVLFKSSFGDCLHNVYKEFKSDPITGIFARRRAILVVNDLDLIKDVLIKDFGKFADRGEAVYEKFEPLSLHLFNLEAERWRPLRSKLSPVFTSGKLREMFYLLIECTEHLDRYLEGLVDGTKNKEMVMELRDLTAKFTTDVIGVCAFGLQMKAIADEDSPFRSMGRRIFHNNWKKLLQFNLKMIAPFVYRRVGKFLVDYEMTDFFIDTMKQTMDYRKRNSVVKHDFIDLLMAIRDHPDKIPNVELTDQLLAAQLFVFFLAGFETSSSTMSNAFYELAFNPQVQDKLRQEIKEEMDRIGGKIEYDGIKSMKYLDMVFQETLRKYPSVTFLTRQSVEPYTLENRARGVSLTIEKAQSLWIPIYAIQRDAQYFPDPDAFIPGRFTEQATKARHPMAYLPFGDGPRNCIGKRFGAMQTKVGIVKILHKYRLEVCQKTGIPYENDPTKFLLAPKNGIYLRIVKDYPAAAAAQQNISCQMSKYDICSLFFSIQ